MSFLKNIFKAKPGGTFVGNLVRGVANKATGGILGNGVMLDASLQKQQAAAITAAATAAPFNPLAQAAAFAVKQPPNIDAQAQQAEMFNRIALDAAKSVAGAVAATPQGRAISFQAIKGAMGKAWHLLYIVPAIIVGGIIYFVTRKKGRR